ncbi:MAG: glycosyltransferase family 4 protein [Thermoleophilia bacterium]|nr:glycosyltransferase family 4 protein [Thermoleophilia bacterium]
MSRVLYVSQYFVSADQPGGVRHWQHTRALARAGHEVTVVSSYVQHKEREIPERYRGRKIVREREDGIDMVRTYATPDYGVDMRSRGLNYLTFAFWSMLAAARSSSPDVVVASSPTLPAAAAAAELARLRGARFILEVRDLWPESILAMNLDAPSWAISAAARMARHCYGRADRIIALTEGIRDGLLDAGVPAGRIHLITNGVDLDIASDPQPVQIAGDDFVAMYVGAHGTYNALHTVLGAAELLRDGPGVSFVLVGGGDQKDRLVEDAERRGLGNVQFIDAVPKREVPSWLARADACLLPYQDVPLFAGALPNKTFDYLGAGKPIVAAAPDGELTRLVREVDCGIAIAPEDPQAMADAVTRLAADPAQARAMGERGMRHAREHYDRAKLAQRFVAVVESVA